MVLIPTELGSWSCKIYSRCLCFTGHAQLGLPVGQCLLSDGIFFIENTSEYYYFYISYTWKCVNDSSGAD